MAKVLITVLSDDLLEISGDIDAEFALTDGKVKVKFKDDSGKSLVIKATYGETQYSEWSLSIGNDAEVGSLGYPGWAIRFGERPDYEGDPAIFIDTGSKKLSVTEVLH